MKTYEEFLNYIIEIMTDDETAKGTRWQRKGKNGKPPIDRIYFRREIVYTIWACIL